MRKSFWFLCVAFMACGGGSGGSPKVGGMDTGYTPQIECTQHSDCYPDHKFCVKGTCVGDPQPDVVPADEVEEDAVENDTEITTDSTIGPWGEIVYAEVVPEVATDSGTNSPADGGDNGVIDNATDVSVQCASNADCASAEKCVDSVCVELNCPFINEPCMGSMVMNHDCVKMPKANGYPCNADSNGCTIDLCIDGKCTFDAVADDGVFCTIDYLPGKCVANKCVSECDVDSDCPSDICSEGSCLSGLCYWEPTDWCVACTDDAGCDLGEQCLNAYCKNYTCMYEPDDTASCSVGGQEGVCHAGNCWNNTPEGGCFDNNQCTDDAIENGQCVHDPVCDDGDFCTQDSCLPGANGYTCVYTKYSECCHADADCKSEFWCDKEAGGVYERTGICKDSTCEITHTTDANAVKAHGCAVPLPCKEDSDCPMNGECLCPTSGECLGGTCLNFGGNYPECASSAQCSFGQICDKGKCVVDSSKFKCQIECIDIAKIAVIWYANTYTEKLADEVFEATPAQLCTWGWDNKPTFKFNCNNGASFWGYGDQAQVTCNDPNFTIKPDKDLGNQGVMVVQFEKQCQ